MVAAASALDQLSEQQQEQVAVIVECCMLAMENGQQVDIDSCISEHPELHESLRKCLTSLQLLHNAVGEIPSKNKFVNTPAPGMHLGDFLLHREIGRGGMGIVYSATQVSLNRTVALKILPESLWQEPKRVRRFQLEAQAAALLQHPNIIPIYAIGTEGNVRFFAMPLIDGLALDLIPKEAWQENDFQKVLDISVDAGDALQHAHDLGVIHRDVKPSNFILDRAGKIWITDFGLAQQANNHSLTISGELIGTLSYMSPEQAAGEPIDHRTDVYSFAATLYELCTGQKAVPNGGVAETLQRIRDSEPVLPTRINTNIPVDLETILLKGLAKDRMERYASIAAMVQDLIAVRNGHPIQGRRPSIWNLTVRWLKRNRFTVVVGSMLGLLAIIASMIALVTLIVKQNEVQTALQAAEQNLKTANENYWLGRDLLDKWNTEIVPLLADDATDPHIRREMLADSIEYYEHFLKRKHNPIDTQLGFTTDLTRVQLAEAYASSNLWKPAIEQLDIVVKNEPELPTASAAELRWYAKARANLGLCYLQLQCTNQAVEHLRLGVELYEKLDGSNLDDITKRTVQLEHAAVLANLGQAYHAAGDSDLGLKQLQTAASLCERLPVDSTYSKGQRLLTQIWDHQATLLADTNPEQALTYSQKSVAMQTRHIDFIRTSWKRIRHYATSLHNLAILYQKQGHLQAALDTLQRTAQQRETAILLTPSNHSLRMDLAVTLNAAGMLQADNGSNTEAGKSFVDAATQLRSARDIAPTQWKAEAQLALLQVLLNLASVAKENPGPEWNAQVKTFQEESQHKVLHNLSSTSIEIELANIRQRAMQLKLTNLNSPQAEQ